jgi:hypothetical protein
MNWLENWLKGEKYALLACRAQKSFKHLEIARLF